MISFKLKKRNELPVTRNTEMHIDCRGCGEPNIGETRCVRCISESIVRFGEPERIILRSGVETELTDETVELLRKITDAFSRTSVGRKGRRCSGCVLSSASLEDEKWEELSTENIDDIIASLGKVFLKCSQCQTCILEAEGYFRILRDKLVLLNEDAAKIAFRIVGA